MSIKQISLKTTLLSAIVCLAVSTLSAQEFWVQHLKVRNNALFFDKEGDQFLAAGENTVWFSPDASLWEGHVAAGLQKDVTRANGLYVAVGSLGGSKQIVTSTEGYRWLPIPFAEEGSFEGVTFAFGRFWVVGGGGDIRSSTDGKDWVGVTPHPDFIASNFNSISFLAGKLLVTGATGAVMFSTDGKEWQRASIPTTSRLTSATFGSNIYMVGTDSGEIFASSNLKKWQFKATVAFPIHRLGFHEAKRYFLAVGDFEAIAASTTGERWDVIQQESLIPPYPQLTSLAYGQKTLVAGGPNGSIYKIKDPYGSYTVVDRYYWKFNGLEYGNGEYLAVGDHFAIGSWDGKSQWQISGQQILEETEGVDYFDVTFDDGLFYLLTSNLITTVSSASEAVRSQPFGSQVGDLVINLNPPTVEGEPPPVALGSGVAVAVGGGYLLALTRNGVGGGYLLSQLTDTGLTTVSAAQAVDETGQSKYRVWNEATYGLDGADRPIFVAVGDNGQVYKFNPLVTSGVPVRLPGGAATTDKLVDVIFCNDETLKNRGFFAISETGVVTQSEDGSFWRSTTIKEMAPHQPTSIRYGNGQLVVVCKNGRIFTASVKNGELTGGIPDQWVERASPVSSLVVVTDSVLNCVAYGDGKFTAAGDTAIVASTDVEVPPVIVTNSANVAGQVGTELIFPFQIVGSYDKVTLQGQIPPGLKLVEDAQIRGIPKQEGIYNVQIVVTYSTGTVSQPLVFTIASEAGEEPDAPTADVNITSPTSAKGVKGTRFVYKITATGDASTYRVVGGLPPGVALKDNKLVGAPKKEGKFNVTIWAVGTRDSDKQRLKITIGPKSPLEPLPLPQ